MGGMVRMTGITAGIADEPVTYDKDGIVYPDHNKVVKAKTKAKKAKVVKPQVTNAKTVSTETTVKSYTEYKSWR